MKCPVEPLMESQPTRRSGFRQKAGHFAFDEFAARDRDAAAINRDFYRNSPDVLRVIIP